MNEELRETLSLLILMQMRIYDTLTLILAADSEEAAKKMQQVHQAMEFVNKTPWE